MDLGPVGVLAGLIVLAQTIIAAIFVSKHRLYVAAYRWRRRMEPIHLDLLDWAFEVQTWAAKRGQRDQLPPLPDSLAAEWDDEALPELSDLRRLGRRRGNG